MPVNRSTVVYVLLGHRRSVLMVFVFSVSPLTDLCTTLRACHRWSVEPHEWLPVLNCCLGEVLTISGCHRVVLQGQTAAGQHLSHSDHDRVSELREAINISPEKHNQHISMRTTLRTTRTLSVWPHSGQSRAERPPPDTHSTAPLTWPLIWPGQIR